MNPLDRFFAVRFARAAQAADVLVQPTFTVGEVTCFGPDNVKADGGIVETFATVGFPSELTEKPTMAFGFEMALDSPRINGRAPTMSAHVDRFFTINRDGTDHYYGMRIAVIISGPVGTKIIVHWSACAQTISGPSTAVVAGFDNTGSNSSSGGIRPGGVFV